MANSRARRLVYGVLCVVTMATATGCASFLEALLQSTVQTTVRIVNNTSYEVDPNIRYSDDNELGDLLITSELAAGRIAAGDISTFTFGCDELGTVFSDDPEQFNLVGSVEADDSPIMRKDSEFQCGDTIEFEFRGDFGSFELITRVNGSILES